MRGETKTSQLKGPFNIRENLVLLMDETLTTSDSLAQIGIQAAPGTKFTINNDEYEIGTTGLYEQMETRITSVTFLSPTDEKTFVEFIMINY